MEAVTCIFCPDRDPRFYHAENGYEAVQCSGCGLVFTSPRPSETEMKHLYEGQETKIDLRRQLQKIEAATAEARRALAMIRRHKPSGHILELGSAAGYFLREAERQGFAATGIDITRQFVEFARDVQGLDAREGTLTGLELAPNSYDVIYHRNVLSHLAYPLESFRRMHELLKPGGIVCFETGNVAELPGSYFGGTNDLDLPDHLYHFSESTLRLLLERTGFEVSELRRYVLVNHEPFLRRRVLRARERRAAARPKPATDAPQTFDLPQSPPKKKALRRLGTCFEHLLRYGLGSVYPSKGRRCTLVVVARAKPDLSR